MINHNLDKDQFANNCKIFVTSILKESRIFNMCIITDTGYINYTIQKYIIDGHLEYKIVSCHNSYTYQVR